MTNKLLYKPNQAGCLPGKGPLSPITVFTAVAFVLMTGLSQLSCDDIFEEDISDKQPELSAPASGLQTTSNEILFSWSGTEGASQYAFELCAPSFGEPYRLVADSTLSGNRLTLTLDPGSYQWRVKAANSAYVSRYSEIFTLTITDEE